MKFDNAQRAVVEKLIEARLLRERRRLEAAHATALRLERVRHAREVQTLRAELARAQSERSVFARLADRWFHVVGRQTG